MRRAWITLCSALILIHMMIGPTVAAKAPYNIAVIVKATESEYWQVVLKGAKAAADKLGGRVKVETFGPSGETDFEKQIAITENVISRRPDAIVIASATEGVVDSLERAYDMGIKVIVIDTMIPTQKYHSFLATDNVKGGAIAADELVKAIKAAGRPLKGKVGVISALGGIPVLIDRYTGFQTRLKQIAPEVDLIPTRYVDNDIAKALAATEDLIASYKDLLGFFADNNMCGDGVARAITEKGLAAKMAAVAFDADPEEIEALKSGALDALIVQDPFGMGYKGVMSAVDALDGKPLPKRVDTGVMAVTKFNLNTPAVQGLLYPEKRKL